MPDKEWLVEYTDEFGAWWDTLSEADHIAIDARVRELERRGPNLPFPYSSGIEGSRFSWLAEPKPETRGSMNAMSQSPTSFMTSILRS